MFHFLSRCKVHASFGSVQHQHIHITSAWSGMRVESRQFTCFAFYRTWPGTEYCKSEHSDSLSCILLRLFNVLLWILLVFNRAVQIASAASKWKCQSAKVPKCPPTAKHVISQITHSTVMLVSKYVSCNITTPRR